MRQCGRPCSDAPRRMDHVSQGLEGPNIVYACLRSACRLIGIFVNPTWSAPSWSRSYRPDTEQGASGMARHGDAETLILEQHLCATRTLVHT